MISAFTARPIVELRPRDRSKIESILAYGDRLLVGLHSGALRVYRVNEQRPGEDNGGASHHDPPSLPPPSLPASPSKTRPVDLLREVEKFSPRAVEQLARLKEANLLIVLTNYHVALYDLNTYVLQEQLVKTKNATTFAVTSNVVKDSTTGIPEIISRLAVAVKRRLLLWTWHETEPLSDNIEITLAEPIRSLTWASATKIICGMNSGYVIADVLRNTVEDIVGPGAIGGATGTQGGRFGGVGSASMGYIGLGSYIPKPLATKLAYDEVLLAKDINSLFINADGRSIDKRQIPWQTAPEAIGYSYPYITTLLPPAKGILEIRNPDTLSLLQTIALPNASQLHYPASNISLAHAGKGFHVVSDRCIWRMEATDYDAQITELVDNTKYDEAISVLGMLEDALLKNKSQRLHEVEVLKKKRHFDQEMDKAQKLFDNRRYREAIDIFIAEEAPPERVIQLFPKVIAGELSIVEEPHEDSGVETEHPGATDIERNSTTELGSPKIPAVSILLKSDTKSSSDTSSIRSIKRLDDIDDAPNRASSERRLEGKDLHTAALELNAFLVGTRNRMKRFFDVETCSLKRADSDQSDAMESLLRGPQSETDKEREEQLLQMAKLVDTTLFRSYMLTNPSLAGSLFRIPNLCDPDVVNQKLLETGRYNDLVDFFHGKKLHRPALEMLKRFGMADDDTEAAPQLKGPRRTVGYLQNLSPNLIELILQFAEWTLRADPALGMEIFLADTENAETLPRDKVVDFLHGINVKLELQYLEHIINELHDLSPDFHNRLVTVYLQELTSARDRDATDWADSMTNLLSFLKSSKQYSLMKAFNLIPKDDDPRFFEAQAIILSNMGEHRQALSIYVFKLKDYAKAEEYCNLVHLHNDLASPSSSRRESTTTDDPLPSIHHTLLSLYLMPPQPFTQNWAPALSLLSKHGSRLPTSSTLDLIPDTLPVSELASYFRGRIRAANSIVNETHIVAGLRKSEVVATQAELLVGSSHPEAISTGLGAGRSRRVLIGEMRVCRVCHKRLGPSVTAVMPDNSVVHYGCLSKLRGVSSNGSREVGAEVGKWADRI